MVLHQRGGGQRPPPRNQLHCALPEKSPCGLYSPRSGAALFRRPSPWRRVDDAPPDHLRSRHSAVRRRGRRPLPADHRGELRAPAACAAGAGGGGRGRARFGRHARAFGDGVGVAQLELPARGPCGGHDLRAVDSHPETAAGRWRDLVDRGLAGRRPHGRRGALRGRRDRGQGQAEIEAARDGTGGRSVRGRPAPPSPSPLPRKRTGDDAAA